MGMGRGTRHQRRERRNDETRADSSRFLDSTQHALELLGVSRRIPGRVRVAVRRWDAAWAEMTLYANRGAWLSIAVLLILEGALQRPRLGSQQVVSLWLRENWASLPFLAILVSGIWLLSRFRQFRGEGAIRFRLVRHAFSTVQQCAAVHEARHARRDIEVRQLAAALAKMEGAIRSAHRKRQFMPAQSHRRVALKQHAGLVVTALRRAEARLDVGDETALAELADMLVTICDRYVKGHVGQLLDEGQLEGLEPVRYTAWLRTLLFVLVVVGGGVGAVLLGVPDGARTYVVGGVAVLAGLALFRGRQADAIKLLEALRGSK